MSEFIEVPSGISFDDHKSRVEKAILKVFIDPLLPKEFRQLYIEHVQKHNENVVSNPYPDAGFDLLVPEDVIFKNISEEDTSFASKFINMGIKVEMSIHGDPCAFTLYPRSSISKTPLMLANHTGIIDMGYRGWIIGAFRNLSKIAYIVPKYTRLLQICHPSLIPIYVELVNEEDALSITIRGNGGFGSTG